MHNTLNQPTPFSQAPQKDKVVPIRLYFLLLGLMFSANIFAKEWAFDVYLDKTKMGTHTFVLDDTHLMTSSANFKVNVLFFNAYSYQHLAKEQWHDDCLTALEAETTENKIKTKVTGQRQGQLLSVSANQNTVQILPACVMTFAYWNPKILTQAKLLNPQNAEYLTTKVKHIGTENIDVKGVDTKTEHYFLQGLFAGKAKLNIDLWYDQNKNWVALQSTTPEGYQVIYKLK